MGFGTVFKLSTNGSGFKILKSFAGYDGRGPRAGLTLVGATLFGTTSDYFEGVSTNWGTVFMVNTNGTGFKVLKYFRPSDGHHPYCDLVLSRNILYGTAAYGGSSDDGVVFGLSLLNLAKSPQTRTA